MTDSEELSLDELREIFGFDMTGLAAKIRERYGLTLENPLPRKPISSPKKS
jgi:hypothetical protein